MKKILVMAIALFAFLAPVLGAAADDPQQEAKALVESAAAFLKANGKEATLAEMNKAGGQFVKGDLYVFAYDLTATIVAHPKNPKLVGKNLMEVPDTDGKQFRKEIVETAKASGFGWVDYKYLNPESKKVEAKTTYLQKAGDIVLCCGTYK
ncbi:MAG: cache domain-containing protein [bacterium]|nr:cache domain-containing protein [bacterium]